jgi:hypothetical protein
MKRATLILGAILPLVVGLLAAAALAGNGNGNGQKPPGGDNPCPPSYHAEGDQCVHNGDGGGNCGQNQSDNGGDHGYGHEECGEETPTETTPTETTPTETTPTTPEPPVEPPTHCVPVNADKDGGHDAYGGTNDDCAPAPPVDPTSPVEPPAPPVVEPPVEPPVVTPPVAPKPKAQRPKPRRAQHKPLVPPRVVHVSKAHHGVVTITTSDGRKHVGVMGSG